MKYLYINLVVLTMIFSGNNLMAQDQFVVIANSDVPVESINKSTIKRIYNGFTTQWSDGTKIKPCYMQIPNNDFWKYIGTTEDNFQRFWTKRVFSGNGVSPIEHKNSTDAIKYVNDISGAIGIIDKADQDNIGNNCKIVDLSN